MVTSMPRVYVAVAGMEKVIPTVEDAVLLWQAASRNATGQNVSVYFSISSGPRRSGHADGVPRLKGAQIPAKTPLAGAVHRHDVVADLGDAAGCIDSQPG